MQQTATSTVVGVFDDFDTARRAAQHLVDEGIRRDQITVTANEEMTGHREPAHDDTGGVAGFFRRLFGGDQDTRDYEEAIRRGGAIVAVTADSPHQDRILEILNHDGAVDIDRRAESWRQQMASESSLQQDDRRIPVVQEELRVGKRMVQRGGVRIYNRMVEEPVQEQVRLREERVRVDRRPADRAATPADLAQREEVIEVTEMAEEPVVDKRTRVVEEVVIGKQATERTETVRDTLRRTAVEVEDLGGNDFRTHFDARYGTDRSARFETYEPAYRYGSQIATREDYRGRRWEDVETSLRSDYERRYPNSKWEQMKDAIRHGWDRATGRG